MLNEDTLKLFLVHEHPRDEKNYLASEHVFETRYSPTLWHVLLFLRQVCGRYTSTATNCLWTG